MSDNVKIAVGTTISISLGKPATYDQNGFEAKSYTEIGEVTTIPEFGGSATVATHVPLKTGEENVAVGTIAYAELSISLAKDYADDGQVAVASAFNGANSRKLHSFKISNPNIGTSYFTGYVTSNMTIPNDANSFFGASFTVRQNAKEISFPAGVVWTVTYIAGANGSIIGDTSQIVANGENASSVYAAPATGYVFVEWTDESDDNPRTDTNVTANITQTATFALDE